jgi:tRNA (guanine-N7-)-methyltransferase
MAADTANAHRDSTGGGDRASRRRPCRSGPVHDPSFPIEVAISLGSIGDPADWDAIFGGAGPFVVEIGVGRDTFLIEEARRRPDRRFLGFEYSRERVERLARKIVLARVPNVRLLRCEALQGIARFLAPGSVEAFYALFPDPWPKKRHAEKRLVSPPAARLLATRLVPGGRLALKTDDAAYADQMAAVLEKTPFLRNAHGPGRLAPPEAVPAHETLYERKWRQEGRAIRALVYVRTEEP